MRLSSQLKKHLPVLAAGLLLTLISAHLYGKTPLFIHLLNNKYYDISLRKIHNSTTSGVPVIIDLDEKSMAAFGQWPWPRWRVAVLLGRLQQAGVKAVGMDIMFAEPDHTSPELLQQEWQRDLDFTYDFPGLPEGLKNNDQLLADNLKDNPYTLGYFFNFETTTSPEEANIHPLNPALVTKEGFPGPDHYLISSQGLTPPLKVLAQAAGNSGFINAIPDFDGMVRSTPLVITWQGKYYPSLALATMQSALGNLPLILKTSKHGLEQMRFGKTEIPLDKRGKLLIHYRGASGAFPYISAADVLNNKLQPGQLENNIALIGTSAAGLKDIRATPFDNAIPGVEIHATVIDNILQGDFISHPYWAFLLEFGLILFSGIITTILIAFSTARWTLPVTLLSGIAMWQGGLWFMEEKRLFISTLFPILTLGANFSMLTLLKFLVTEHEKRFFREAFSKYVSPSVVNQIAESPDTLSLDGQEKEMSILFSDVRGFTSLSEKLTPTQVILLLNDYFTPMTRVITENMGTLDKFIGDAIMAFWNAPLDVPDHKEMAVKSGIRMVDELNQLNITFQEKYGFTIDIGVGLHTGMARVGNMGTDELFDYTIIGDNVNLASRLEGLTKFYGVKVLISETLKDSCPPGYRPQELDLVQVKGKEKPIAIYGVFSEKEAREPAKEMELYEKALGLYRASKFSEARTIFQTLHQEHDDRLLYRLYEERCDHFLTTPPPENWGGVFRHTSK